MSFTDILTQMPSYAKFLKEILSNKRKLEEHQTVALTTECSAVLQNNLPQKLEDPDCFAIPCLIGNFYINKALCDLGTSVSLMPLSIFEKIGFGELKLARIPLQLADRSVRYSTGILEDVSIRVGKLIVPVDFVVVEMEEDPQIPIILGRAFLITVGAFIDVKNDRLTLNVGDEKVEFNFSKTIKRPSHDDSCLRIDYFDTLEQKILNEHIISDSFGHNPLLDDWSDSDEEDNVCENQEFELLASTNAMTTEDVGCIKDNSGRIGECDQPASDDPPKVELKPLPSNLRYVFL
jgi:hypothetical protein